MTRRFAVALLLAVAFFDAQAQTSARPGLLLISLDGMRPEYVNSADQYGLKIPNLRRILNSGAHAQGVRGVLPTVTYPSHTTILTGVWPVKHGIYDNLTFDPVAKNLDGWYWYSEDIRVPTLWAAASAAGYAVGSVSWPVSVGAPGVNFLIPEYWRAVTADDIKVVRALSTPGLLNEFEKQLGPYITDLDAAVNGDWSRTRYAEAIIRKKHARFLTLHLAALDHLEHATGPFSPEALATLEENDKMVGVLYDAMRAETPEAAVCIVSDHGFMNISHSLNLKVAFVQAGFLKPNPRKTTTLSPGVSEWTAAVWTSAGSAMVIVKDPNDTATRSAVEKMLRGLAADPANGIDHILGRQEIAELGGASNADFVVDMKPGFSIGNALDGPLVRDIKPGGTHGYSPTHPEMRASFLIAGPGIRQQDVGQIDMRSIAPTLAKYLGASLPTADLPPLDIFTVKK